VLQFKQAKPFDFVEWRQFFLAFMPLLYLIIQTLAANERDQQPIMLYAITGKGRIPASHTVATTRS
jgi:hypothetical protein